MRAQSVPGTAGRRLTIAHGRIVLCVALAVVVTAGTASAWSTPTPWTGTNPYHCHVQNAGLGTTVRHPGADPYCVSFNKTEQNITQLGIVTFLLNEPARTAAAVPKCFYFQEDHWRGSIIQDDGQTELYQFRGHYFFNKATGDGGAWIDDFTVNGKTFNPTTLPFFPAQYKADFGPGTGGVITHDDVPVVPQCVAMAKDDPKAVYADPSDPET
jgi:hypothetical protein